jgi:hypothetical protein
MGLGELKGILQKIEEYLSQPDIVSNNFARLQSVGGY